MEISFEVQGSAEYPYTVSFQKIGAKLSTECSCPAGENGMHCKHRIRILNGMRDGIVSGNESDVDTVASWLPGTYLGETLQALSIAEEQFEAAQNELKRIKKQLDRALIGI